REARPLAGTHHLRRIETVYASAVNKTNAEHGMHGEDPLCLTNPAPKEKPASVSQRTTIIQRQEEDPLPDRFPIGSSSRSARSLRKLTTIFACSDVQE
ncbi:hypothetical protein, partial [Mesorhizobium australicum]|uniref:hypothetical protein n=1 Tax=Mesorhizobium australicum TaxID=536018 RepID=UPI00333C989D